MRAAITAAAAAAATPTVLVRWRIRIGPCWTGVRRFVTRSVDVRGAVVVSPDDVGHRRLNGVLDHIERLGRAVCQLASHTQQVLMFIAHRTPPP
jgi:hypothetical protein